MEFALGDIITMKKPHPCGCRDWEVLVEKNFRGFVKKTLA